MMTSNKDQSTITKKDLKKMAVNSGSLGMEYSWNYERQMNLAFCKMMDPILKKIYKNDPKKYQEALKRHLEFFNITVQFAPFVGGVVASMEELNAKDEIDPSSISSVKTALMGPLSGIGDSVFLGCLRVIAVGVGLPLSLAGNPLGPILFLLIYNIPAFMARFIGAQKGYELGVSYLDKFQEDDTMSKVMFAAGILGIMVIGCMSKDMVYTSLALEFGAEGSENNITRDIRFHYAWHVRISSDMAILLATWEKSKYHCINIRHHGCWNYWSSFRNFRSLEY